MTWRHLVPKKETLKTEWFAWYELGWLHGLEALKTDLFADVPQEIIVEAIKKAAREIRAKRLVRRQKSVARAKRV